MHNGLIRDFHLVKRELQSSVDDAYFGFIEGTTDSETMFYLALTFGLEDDPVGESSGWSASSRRRVADAGSSVRSR
jgi:predicted glutamine amidotransferase